ncbi:MAG: ChbG/HpnK family deacetylase [Clostridia bacterium]|nr:ChbG/HpnK family deacetylase [Clostridia bacterium]
MYEIDYHADDYASSPENSRRILFLVRAGRVDSFSVLTNMGCFGECMRLLRESWDLFPRKPLLSVHLNLIDGRWLSSPEAGKIIRQSWAGILLRSLLPGRRKKMLALFSAEIEAQITSFLTQTADLKDEAGRPLELRIDSHVHTHMIPLVFRALLAALDRMRLTGQVRFIRCSTEPFFIFFRTPGVTGTVPLINLLKNIILKVLSVPIRKQLRRMGIPTGYIFGVALTGEMDLKRVLLLRPGMSAYAQKKDVLLEVLSHPGRVLPEEVSEEYGPEDRKAFVSPMRDVEYQMLRDLPRSAES